MNAETSTAATERMQQDDRWAWVSLISWLYKAWTYSHSYVLLKGSALMRNRRTILTDTLVDIEINFIGRVPRNAVILRLQVDDTTQESKPKERTRTANWNCEMYVRLGYLNEQLWYVCRYVSQRSRITLSILRVKKGIRNPFADAVIATIVLEAGNPGTKENTVCSRSGMYRLIRPLFSDLQTDKNLAFEQTSRSESLLM